MLTLPTRLLLVAVCWYQATGITGSSACSTVASAPRRRERRAGSLVLLRLSRALEPWQVPCWAWVLTGLRYTPRSC